MEIKAKVVLKQKGAKANLGLDKFEATMRWKTSVDVDLHCVYETKDGKTGEVYYGRKNHSGSGFKIVLDEDAGVGNTVGSQGFNEENIRFENTSSLKKVILFTNIYGGAKSYSSIGAHILVGKNNNSMAPEIEVDLTSSTKSKVYQICEIDFSSISPVITSLDFVSSHKPRINGSASNNQETDNRGFFGRLFN